MNSASPKAGDVVRALRVLGTAERAKVYARFFKTGPGEYGEGDRFLGVTVPQQRKVAKVFARLSLSEIDKLLDNPYHECRLTALLILVGRYERGDERERRRVAAYYLKNAKRVNNWDLVDSSAPRILGVHFLSRDRTPLYRLARSSNLWQRRIAIVATLAFIARGEFEDTFRIASIYLSDRRDLIQKATGWMLREVGKRSRSALDTFLGAYASLMPRTMLRYAIERHSQRRKKMYLRAK